MLVRAVAAVTKLPEYGIKERSFVAMCPDGHGNPVGNSFCGTCGASLTQTSKHEPLELASPPPVPSASQQGLSLGRKWLLAAAGVIGLTLIAVGAVGSAMGRGHESAAVTHPPSAPPSSQVVNPVIPPPSVSTPKIKIPNVIGESLKDAKAKIQKAVNSASGEASVSLNLGYKYSDQPPGSVLATGPAHGVRVDSGSTVELTLAKPIPEIPSVVQVPVNRARRELENLGFSVRIRQQVSALAKGTVISQSVAPGTLAIPERTTVILTTAKPPQGWYIRVEGSGAALVTWGNIEGTSQQTVSLPFSIKVSTHGDFDVISVVAQRQSGDSGTIVCEVVHSGRVVKRSPSAGAYAVCSASKSV